jgi:CMP/dCMP kinase
LRPINIAIDGPAGAGKSTIARLVAEGLGFIYVDTGAMYRAVTWKALQLGLTPDQTEEVARAAYAMTIDLKRGPAGQLVYVDGQDVTEAIRSNEVTRLVSEISSIRLVRELLVGKQKEMAAAKGVVMDGRDIGTQVLPDAELKIFMTADVRERAIRRLRELSPKDSSITLEELEQDIQRRDTYDAERPISPLAKAPDAVLLDSTGMGIDEVVDRIMDLCESRTGGRKT